MDGKPLTRHVRECIIITDTENRIPKEVIFNAGEI